MKRWNCLDRILLFKSENIDVFRHPIEEMSEDIFNRGLKYFFNKMNLGCE